MSAPFETLLRDIAQEELGETPGADFLAELQAVLEENHLDTESNVPAWLKQFFTALHHRQSLPLTPEPDEQTEAEVGEFFASLQALAPFDCLDDGEWMRVRLSQHSMLGFVSVERGAYLVTPLSQVPDDGKSDLSRAKLLDRPA